jgi:hypothetical protein
MSVVIIYERCPEVRNRSPKEQLRTSRNRCIPPQRGLVFLEMIIQEDMARQYPGLALYLPRD